MTEQGGVGWDRELKERWPSGWCDMAGCELRCCISKIRTTGDASAPLRNPHSHKATRPKDHFPHSCTGGGPTLTPSSVPSLPPSAAPSLSPILLPSSVKGYSTANLISS